LRLHARSWGAQDGPSLLFVHGWSQSDLCWTTQLRGQLADRFRIVTFDLRGHGMSEKPSDAEAYTDGRRWADDLAAVVEQTGLDRPVVVAWSYGGYVVSDYLRVHGDAAIGGIDLVAAAVVRTPTFDHIGQGLLANAGDACAPDLAANISAVQRFLRACTAQPITDEEWSAVLAWNMVVPPQVRAALFERRIDGRDALARTSVPVLVTHGLNDAIVLPTMAEEVLRVLPTAARSWYDGIGHMPFWEAAERFDRELARFADRAQTSPVTN
jgi:pimeloyl-ACP methyl ester carboxylesterase